MRTDRPMLPLALFFTLLSIPALFGPYPEVAAQPPSSPTAIVYGGDHDYPPFEYLDGRGRPAGFNIDLIRAIGERENLEIEIRLGQWHEIIADLRAGEIHVIAMFHSERRSEFADFAFPNTVVFHHVYSTGGQPFIDQIESLREHKVIVQQGGYAHNMLVVKGLDHNIVMTLTEPDALRALSAGDGDYALVARVIGQYAIENHNLQLAELLRWQDVMLDREGRVQALKREVNELCRCAGEAPRYRSQEES